MGGEGIQITCGTLGNPCKSLEEYPVCSQELLEGGWVGVEELAVGEIEGHKPTLFVGLSDQVDYSRSVPKLFDYLRPPTLSEINEALSFLKEDKNLGNSEFIGVCRARDLSRWCAYEDSVVSLDEWSLAHEIMDTYMISPFLICDPMIQSCDPESEFNFDIFLNGGMSMVE